MINRIDFLKNISNDSIVQVMTTYFDQNMALYNLIYKNIDKVIINQVFNDNNTVTFNIKFQGIDHIGSEIENLITLPNDVIFCYGKKYSTNLNKSKDQIDITFIEVVA